MSDGRLWLVGEFISEEPRGNVWDFCGVFDDIDPARDKCREIGENSFIAPVRLNDKAIPKETHYFPECIYPEIGGNK